MRAPSATTHLLFLTTAFALCATSLAQDEHLKTISGLIENYCADCHNADEKTAGLDLDSLDVNVAHKQHAWDTEVWEKVVRRLRAGQMPPADVDRPSRKEYDDAIVAFETILDDAAKKFPRAARTEPVRRLNRTEYRNAIRDLIGITVDVETLLPSDSSGHGFDNVTVSGLSPALLSRYITAAEHISRTAIGRGQRGPGGLTVRLPADRTQESHVEGLPLGTRGGTLIEHHFAVSGEYEIQLRLMRDRDENIEGLNGDYDLDVLLDRQRVHRFRIVQPASKKNSVNWARDDTLVDANLKKRFDVTAGLHRIGVTFPDRSGSLSEISRQPFAPSFNRHRHPRKSPALFEVSIVGPFTDNGPGDTASRRLVFGDVETSDEAAAKKILSRLTRLAYRRPITEQDLTVPLEFFQSGFANDGFDAGIESALAAILVNPHFLLRAESEQTEATHRIGSMLRISDLELASRLSFFLWSSIPDDELLGLAEAGQLHEPSVLRKQVERMLREKRSESLVKNFAGQWLYLRNLASFQPDRRLFPDFDDNLRTAMRRETELCFERVLREDRSVLDLIRSDTTFLNERLAQHYGIEHVRGSQFRPVEVSDENHRGGLLRQASILAVTSYATRTSPTVRGNWVLENILGIPAAPPPPNIPSLPEKTAAAELTIRERLAEHRANPACASCHNLMDPVGFSLENFDAVGRWRIFDQGQLVDAAGSMPDGTTVAGVSELEAGILERPEMFVGTLTEKLLTFALGRGIAASDAPAIRKVVRESADKNYAFSSLIAGIATSQPFQFRPSPELGEHQPKVGHVQHP